MADYMQYDQNAEGAGFGGYEEEAPQQNQQQTGTQQKTQTGPKKVQNTYPANVAQILKCFSFLLIFFVHSFWFFF